MTALLFVDTNVLVYAIDAAAGERHRAARRLLEALWSNQQDGQDIDGLLVVSPFRMTPEDLD